MQLFEAWPKPRTAELGVALFDPVRPGLHARRAAAARLAGRGAQSLFGDDAFVGREAALVRLIGMTVLVIGWFYVLAAFRRPASSSHRPVLDRIVPYLWCWCPDPVRRVPHTLSSSPCWTRRWPWSPGPCCRGGPDGPRPRGAAWAAERRERMAWTALALVALVLTAGHGRFTRATSAAPTSASPAAAASRRGRAASSKFAEGGDGPPVFVVTAAAAVRLSGPADRRGRAR